MSSNNSVIGLVATAADADAYVDLYVYDGGSAHDLAASEWITVDLDFRRARS